MNSEFRTLTAAQQTAVRTAISECRRTDAHSTINTADGEAYAYPKRDGIAWGFNSGETGFCIARGVMKEG